MDLRHLEYFVAVAEELHFGRAALRLGIAQPPLSRQIMALERELGTPLFSRTKRHVELTAAGLAMLDGARRTLAQAQQAADAARKAGRGESGSLSVAFVGSATYGLLPRIFRAFRKRFADVQLELLEMGSGEQFTAVAEGRLDLGLVRSLSPQAHSDERVVSMVVEREPLIVALPSNHPLARLETVPLNKLSTDSFILVPREPRVGFRTLVLSACAKAGFSPRVSQEAQEVQTAVSLVAAGLGVSIVPSSVRSLKRANVVYRDLSPRTISDLIAIYRKTNPPLPLQHFLKIISQVALERPVVDKATAR